MRKVLRAFCIGVCLGGSSVAVLFGFFYLLQQMILTKLLALQVIAVALLLCLALAYVAGAVLLVLMVKARRQLLQLKQEQHPC